jgi:hypothetical protein
MIDTLSEGGLLLSGFAAALRQVAGKRAPTYGGVDRGLAVIASGNVLGRPRRSSYPPFFTTEEELKPAASSGRTLADSFGVRLSSESTTYSVYEMAPLKPTEVFISEFVPR